MKTLFRKNNLSGGDRNIPLMCFKAKDNQKTKKKIEHGGKHNEKVLLNNHFIADGVHVYVDSV